MISPHCHTKQAGCLPHLCTAQSLQSCEELNLTKRSNLLCKQIPHSVQNNMCFDISLANPDIRGAIPEQHLHYLHCLGHQGSWGQGRMDEHTDPSTAILQFSLPAQSSLKYTCIITEN